MKQLDKNKVKLKRGSVALAASITDGQFCLNNEMKYSMFIVSWLEPAVDIMIFIEKQVESPYLV